MDKEAIKKKGLAVIADGISEITARPDSEYGAINAAEIRGKIRLMYELELIDLGERNHLQDTLRSAQMYAHEHN